MIIDMENVETMLYAENKWIHFLVLLKVLKYEKREKRTKFYDLFLIGVFFCLVSFVSDSNLAIHIRRTLVHSRDLCELSQFN